MDAMTAETLADVQAFAVPELAVEFTDTLCRFWRLHRADYTTQSIPREQLYLLLDSLASVVLSDDGDDSAT